MMPQFFINRPVFAWVVSLFIILAGLLSLPKMSVSQFPTLAPPSVTITANYPGATAKTVSESVTSLIELELNGLKNLLFYESNSESNGQTTITVTFRPGTNSALAAVDVQNKIKAVEGRLPQAVIQQGLTVEEANSAFLLMGSFISDDPTHDEIELSDMITRNVIDEIRRVPGVGRANLFGMERAMRVWLNMDKMIGYNLSAEDVTAAIAAQNVQVTAGSIGAQPTGPTQQLTATVSVNGQLQTVEQFGEIVIVADHEGKRVLLKDIARIEIGAENYQVISQFNGRASSSFSVQLSPGANALETSRAIRAKLKELEVNFPKGVSVQVAFDTSLFVEASIKRVLVTLAEAAVLVVLVIFVFLQSVRYTLIPTIVVPIALLGTLAVMLAMGMSINMLTLFGMILAIGILVDDPIIVVENVERIMAEESLSPVEATRKAMKQISGALIGITLVLAAVFIPMAFMDGSVGIIYRQFSVSMSASILFSAFLALSLTPALCATLLPALDANHSEKKGVFGWFNRMLSRTTDVYGRVVEGTLGRPRMMIISYVCLIGALVIMFGRLPTSFVPNEDSGWMDVDIVAPAGTTRNGMKKVVSEVEKHLDVSPGVDDYISIYGSGSSGAGQNSAQIWIILKDWSERDSSQSPEKIKAAADEELSKIKGAIVTTMIPPTIYELGSSNGFDLRLQDRTGQGHAALMAAKDRLVEMAKGSSIVDGNSLRIVELPESAQLELRVDRQKAYAHDVTFDSINRTLSTALGSDNVNDFPNLGRMQRVIVQADQNNRMQPQDLMELRVRNKVGNLVPVSAFADYAWVRSPNQVFRYNGYPAIRISGSPMEGRSTGEAMLEMEKIVRNLPGFSYEWTGQSLQEKISGMQVPILLSLSILVVFLVLAALYESWAIPLSVILIVPLGVVGSVIAVMSRSMPNDVFFKVGLITIIGLSAKNAILIIEFAKDMHAKGMPLLLAAVEASKLRFRPILMTSLAFILGVLPLAIATGPGSASQQAMGTTVLGGMITATVLAIFTAPFFFVIIHKIVKCN